MDAACPVCAHCLNLQTQHSSASMGSKCDTNNFNSKHVGTNGSQQNVFTWRFCVSLQQDLDKTLFVWSWKCKRIRTK